MKQLNQIIKNQFNSKPQDDIAMDTHSTLVKYIISDDYDDINVPNAFIIDKQTNDIRYHHIQSAFPIDGSYHFRFRIKIAAQDVWLDIQNHNKPLPLYNGYIFIKAQQQSTTNQQQPIVNQQPHQSIQQAQQQQQPQQQNDFDAVFGNNNDLLDL